MKKRILTLFVCVIALIMIVSVTCHAAGELPEVNTTQTSAEPSGGQEPDVQTHPPESTNTESKETNYTLFGRIWEYIVTNKDAALGAAGDISLLALACFAKVKNDGKTSTLLSKITTVQSDVSGTASSQKSVNNVINTMIDGYNNLTNTYEKYGKCEDDRSRVNGAVLVTNTAILEILTTVYSNSKNLPQGVKDLVNLKYANCLKSLENDEMLKSIVAMVRNSIVPETDTPAAEETESNTEV